MTTESETYRMLPKTITLLETDIEKRRNEVIDISKQSADLWEGDQWHSTAYREQQQKKELAIRFLQMIDQKKGKIEPLSKPSQNNHVEVGHMVKIRLLDDIDVVEARIPFTIIHVLTKEDAQYLGAELDNIREMIVSSETPIAQALFGLKRGDNATYLKDQRLQILTGEDAISASSFFER